MLKNLFRRNNGPGLHERAQQVVRLTSNARPDPEQLWQELQPLCQAAGSAAPVEIEETLRILRTALSHSHPQISGMVAMAGGALVESGAPAALWAEALRERVPGILSNASRFAAETSSRMEPEDEDSEDEEDWDDGALFVASRPVPEQLLEELQQRDTPAVSAYRSLELWAPPLISCFSRSTEQRHAASADTAFRDAIEQLSIYHSGIEMVYSLLEVLDQEPLLVLHPDSGKGFACRMSGIGINFELHMLLMDLLCSPEHGVPGKRLAPNVARIAWGRSEEQAEESCVGNWNLYDWRAAALDLADPNTLDSTTWIWNEGTPADIPIYDDYRVVLLGKPGSKRSWTAGRLFPGLRPELTVERVLPPEEVQSFLSRMAITAEQIG